MSFLKSAPCTWNVSPVEKESMIFLAMVDVRGGTVMNLTLVPRVRRDLCWDTGITEKNLCGIKWQFQVGQKPAVYSVRSSGCEKLAWSPCNVWIFAKIHRRNMQAAARAFCTGALAALQPWEGWNLWCQMKRSTDTGIPPSQKSTDDHLSTSTCAELGSAHMVCCACCSIPTGTANVTENSQKNPYCCNLIGNEIRGYLLFLLKKNKKLKILISKLFLETVTGPEVLKRKTRQNKKLFC